MGYGSHLQIIRAIAEAFFSTLEIPKLDNDFVFGIDLNNLEMNGAM